MQGSLVDNFAAEDGDAVRSMQDFHTVEPIRPLSAQMPLDANFVDIWFMLCWLVVLRLRHCPILVGGCDRVSLAQCTNRIAVAGDGCGDTKVGLEVLLGYEPEFAGAGDGLSTALHLKLAVDVAVVPFDGAQRQEEPFADFIVGKSICDEVQHL